MGAHCRPKVGCFFIIVKMQDFCSFITQLVNRLQQLSLHNVREDILPLVLTTKRPLIDIWMLKFMQKSFGCFHKNADFQFVSGIHKIVYLIAQQPNIPSETILYSKQTGGNPLSPSIRIVAVAYLRAE